MSGRSLPGLSIAGFSGLICCSAVTVLALPSSVGAQAASRTARPAIAWDTATLRLVEAGGDYARMARLRDGSIACVYDRARKMWIRHSTNEGMTWKPPILVAEQPDCWLTNADLLPLRDGTLLYFWNERPLAAVRRQHEKAPPGTLIRPFLIRAACSTDLGRTWSKPQTPYTAGNSFQDGCWEPVGLQLPSGETLLSYQESADGTMDRCRMAVCVGDANARDFTNRTYPIPLGPVQNQAWNSLFVKDVHTVTAISTATVNGVRGIWAIDGRVARQAKSE